MTSGGGSALKYKGVVHHQFTGLGSFDTAIGMCAQKIVIDYKGASVSVKRDATWTIELWNRTEASDGAPLWVRVDSMALGVPGDWDDHRNALVFPAGATDAQKQVARAACRNQIKEGPRFPSVETVIPTDPIILIDDISFYDCHDRYQNRITQDVAGVADGGFDYYFDWLS